MVLTRATLAVALALTLAPASPARAAASGPPRRRHPRRARRPRHRRLCPRGRVDPPAARAGPRRRGQPPRLPHRERRKLLPPDGLRCRLPAPLRPARRRRRLRERRPCVAHHGDRARRRLRWFPCASSFEVGLEARGASGHGRGGSGRRARRAHRCVLIKQGWGWSFASLTLTAALLAGGCFFSPPECELCADPSDDVCFPAEGEKPPPDACGTFVSSSLGQDGADGSKSAPLRTLGEALARAAPGARIYACGERFEEALVVPPSVWLFGGLDCTEGFWYAPSKGRTEIAGPPGVPAITLPPAPDAPQQPETRIVDVRAVGAPPWSRAPPRSPCSRTTRTSSSSARRSSPPTAPTARTAPRTTSPRPPARTAGPAPSACTAGLVPGATTVQSACDDGFTDGGRGGDGALLLGDDGADGAPETFVNHGVGAPEAGATLCTPGKVGAPGTSGEPGAGGTSLGILGPSGIPRRARRRGHARHPRAGRRRRRRARRRRHVGVRPRPQERRRERRQRRQPAGAVVAAAGAVSPAAPASRS